MNNWKDKYVKFKSVYKLFWLWQDDKYERWLNKMSYEGWHLVGVNYPGIKFYFVKGEPKNYVYKLDYNILKGSNLEMENYLDIFETSGWEYLCMDLTWNYFRKEMPAGMSDDIYSDNTSKIQKYKSMINLVLGLGILNLIPFVYNTILFFVFRNGMSLFPSILGFVCILLLSYALYKFKNRIEQLKNPIT